MTRNDGSLVAESHDTCMQYDANIFRTTWWGEDEKDNINFTNYARTEFMDAGYAFYFAEVTAVFSCYGVFCYSWLPVSSQMSLMYSVILLKIRRPVLLTAGAGNIFRHLVFLTASICEWFCWVVSAWLDALFLESPGDAISSPFDVR